ncbi:MAG: DUF4097 domain-containing protein [Clostridiales bacterium]|nr:DUF4097 domain-containing protein [Clostridiales bacterium]
MKQNEKKIWSIALVLLAIGLLIGFIGCCILGFDFRKLDTTEKQTRVYEWSQEVRSLSVDMNTTDLKILPSEDGKGKVVCHERENEPHTVSEQEGVLTIRCENRRKWYDYIGFTFGKTEVCVYLPQAEYEKLTVDIDTGDVFVASEMIFKQGKVETDTGDITWQAAVTEKLSLSTDTGDIEAKLQSDLADLEMETETGDIDIVDTACANMKIESDTGDVELKNVVVAGDLRIQTSTGDVELKDSDGATMFVKTSTGDVSGRLLRDKTFITRTSTGDVEVPKTQGGICEIVTSTGDIEIKIRK